MYVYDGLCVSVIRKKHDAQSILGKSAFKFTQLDFNVSVLSNSS
jgi:hypothetical protein